MTAVTAREPVDLLARGTACVPAIAGDDDADRIVERLIRQRDELARAMKYVLRRYAGDLDALRRSGD